MAIIANCTHPGPDYEPETYVQAVTRTNAFPILPVAWGFCTDVENDWEIKGLDPVAVIFGGPLHPGGSYLEPTIGQIWPRIG